MPTQGSCDNCTKQCQTKLDIRAEVSITMANGICADFIAFSTFPDTREHIALRLGKIQQETPPLVRIHSECLTGDVFGSSRCDCGPQLSEAITRIASEGGYLLYLRQEGRGIGLAAKLECYQLQDQGLDTYEANERLNYPDDMRSYEAAAYMLRALGVSRVKLLTNNMRKVDGLLQMGVSVTERISTSVFINEHNARYLRAKRLKGRHQIATLE